jgi:hypothetical protein
MKYDVTDPKVKHTFVGGGDPMNPSRLTLSAMRKKPYSLWLKYIEPKLIIMGPEAEDCWCWDVDKRVHRTENWYPQDAANPEKSNMSVRRFIAHMFFKFPDHYSICRNTAICTQNNCVRPSHMIISPIRRGGKK